MPEEKEFFDKTEAEWFERAMKRSNYITKLFKKVHEFSNRCIKGDWQ